MTSEKRAGIRSAWLSFSKDYEAAMTYAIDNYRQKKAELEAAKARLDLIGKKQPYTTAKATGYLHSLTVKTSVHFQPSDGAKNYHDDDKFDAALAAVIKSSFAQLAAHAIAVMERDVAIAARAATKELEQLRAEFAAIEKGGA